MRNTKRRTKRGLAIAVLAFALLGVGGLAGNSEMNPDASRVAQAAESIAEFSGLAPTTAEAATVLNMYRKVYDCDYFLGIRHNCRYVGWYQTNPPYNPNFGWKYIGNHYI